MKTLALCVTILVCLAGCGEPNQKGLPGMAIDWQNNSNYTLALGVRIANAGGGGDRLVPGAGGGIGPGCEEPTSKILWMRVTIRHSPDPDETGELFHLGNYTGIECSHHYSILVNEDGSVEVFEIEHYSKRPHWWWGWWSDYKRQYSKRGDDLEQIPP